MNIPGEYAYSEGYTAAMRDESSDSCPYDSGLDREYWHDGYEDALEDLEQLL